MDVRDEAGLKIEVGTAVMSGAGFAEEAKVVALLEPDLDYGPHVRVEFGDGVVDDFPARSSARWYTEPEEPYICGDVRVIPEEEG
jgi:hypothetical protein